MFYKRIMDDFLSASLRGIYCVNTLCGQMADFMVLKLAVSVLTIRLWRVSLGSFWVVAYCLNPYTTRIIGEEWHAPVSTTLLLPVWTGRMCYGSGASGAIDHRGMPPFSTITPGLPCSIRWNYAWTVVLDFFLISWARDAGSTKFASLKFSQRFW